MRALSWRAADADVTADLGGGAASRDARRCRRPVARAAAAEAAELPSAPLSTSASAALGAGPSRVHNFRERRVRKLQVRSYKLKVAS